MLLKGCFSDPYKDEKTDILFWTLSYASASY